MSTGGKLPHGDRRKTFADVSLGIRAGRWAPKAGGLRISAVLEIMKNSTVGSFCKGRANFFHGAMGVQLDPDSIEVSIYDNDLCGKAAFVRMKDSKIRCTCGYSGRGPCSHAVAMMLHTLENVRPPSLAESRSHTTEYVLKNAPTAKMIKFLAAQLKRDKKLEERFLAHFASLSTNIPRDYRGEMSMMFENDANAGHAGHHLNEFFTAAKAREKAGNYDEAARIYRAIIEFASCKVGSLESPSRYEGYIYKALQRTTSCMATQNPDKGQVAEHARFVIGRLLLSYDIHQDPYYDHMLDLCKAGLDPEPIIHVLEQVVNTITPDPGDISVDHEDLFMLSSIWIDVIEESGMVDTFRSVYARYHRSNPVICVRYAAFILKEDSKASRSILSECSKAFRKDVMERVYSYADEYG